MQTQPFDSISEASKDFLAERKNRGASPNTLNHYRSALGKFEVWAAENGITMLGELNRPVFREYITAISATLAPGGVHARLRPLRALFTWLFEDDVTKTNLMAGVKLPKVPDVDKSVVRREDLKKIINAAGETQHPLRDTALVAVLFDTGLRVSELCELKITSFNSMGITVNGKGGKLRMVPITRTAMKLLNRYMRKEQRREPGVETLFMTNSGESLNRDSVKKILARLCKVAGTDDFSPHSFRRGFALQFLREGGTPFALQRILGHSTLTMTMRYVHMSDTDLKEIHRAADPLGRAMNYEKSPADGLFKSQSEDSAVQGVKRLIKTFGENGAMEVMSGKRVKAR